MTRKEFKRDRRGGINLSDPHNSKIIQEIWRDHWLADHSGRTVADWRKIQNDDQDSEYWKWRRAVGAAYVAAMYAAWLRDHPGNPLPEHLCSLSKAEYAEYEEWLAQWKRQS